MRDAEGGGGWSGGGKGGKDGKGGWNWFGVVIDGTDGRDGEWLVGDINDGKDSGEGLNWFEVSLMATVVMMAKVRNDGNRRNDG